MTAPVVVAVGYAGVLVAAALASLSATLPSNVVWERTQFPAVRAELNMIAAQDFAFFTRSPQTEQIDAYRLGEHDTVGASLRVTPQARSDNWFGLSRSQRAQGPELANLLRVVPAGAWIDCTELDRSACVAAVASHPKTLLHNSSPAPTVCGQVAFTIETITKWPYRRLSADRYQIERIAAASVDCPQGH